MLTQQRIAATERSGTPYHRGQRKRMNPGALMDLQNIPAIYPEGAATQQQAAQMQQAAAMAQAVPISA